MDLSPSALRGELSRVPDDSLIVPAVPATSIPGAGVNRLVATRDQSGSYLCQGWLGSTRT